MSEDDDDLLDPIIWDEPLLSRIHRALFEAFVLYMSNAPPCETTVLNVIFSRKPVLQRHYRDSQSPSL